ncbi:glycosyltransferase family 4 protein, partial [Candidatus Gottesmanbacteria bacterium]|nr:glycosyltransferase family 4 protein [Candidatus Gottesmanbacteria bacterium]
GFYIENLKKALEEYFPENKYIFFTRGELLPKDLDLVHYSYFEPFFLTLPLLKKFPAVVTIHDLIPLVFSEHFPAGIKGRLKWEIQKFSLRNVSAIITDSQSSKNDIMRFTGIDESKINVVYLAPGKEFRKLEAGKKYQLPDKFALYVGDATWNKNLPKLIEAMELVKIPLVMVGKALVQTDFDKTNPWNQDLTKVQEMANKNKKIIRLGFIPTDDLVKVYNLATVFVMPSIYEGFGLPILEAMACGCPVVTAKTSSLPEICEKAAIMVDPYDVNDIVRGIREVLNNRLVHYTLQKEGLMQAKKFTWEKTARETVAVYKKVL